ncbi:MAG: hypothetical protein Tp1102DCM384591_43 [Prokaryotic dsDNA virus sp.]|nr:MAG: hypothetical protein Tp1102DCM384591_43 [Prokaryotic dsDNA virus sp.]|tara:strand:+ start:21684 stop:22046 length:363 start_codon:yes stop_codon:yes gene_type:complete
MINKNEIQKIFNKLPEDKVELEKIELGLVDDALKWIKGVKIFGKNIDIDEDELNKVKLSIKMDIESIQEDLNALKKGIKAVEAAAKDLGVSPNDIPKYKEALSAVQYGEKQIQKGKKLLK